MGRFDCGRYSLPLGEKTYIMGIVNVTPDSFSDGGVFFEPQKAADCVHEMLRNGADIIDIGAQSTRPGHIPVSPEEEIRRLSAVFELIGGDIGVPLSIDTYYPEVAEFAIAHGADIINDVSGVFSEDMARVIKKSRAGWIVMHTGGGDADIIADYSEGVVTDVLRFFEDMKQKAMDFGFEPHRICFDAGIGFGKTHEENIELLATNKLKNEEYALLMGASRKRVIGAATGEARPDARMAGSVAAHCACIFGGADIIRVHDVPESVQAAKMCDAMFRGK